MIGGDICTDLLRNCQRSIWKEIQGVDQENHSKEQIKHQIEDKNAKRIYIPYIF